MKSCFILICSFIILSQSLFQAKALTLAQIAGTYEGWRMETSPSGTIRYLEMDEILPDGTFNTLLVDEEHGIVIAETSVITLDEDGNIAGIWADFLDIHGPQLQIKARSGQSAVHAATHRTD